MRIIWEESEFENAWDSARAEAKRFPKRWNLHRKIRGGTPLHRISNQQATKRVLVAHLSERDCLLVYAKLKLVENLRHHS